MIPDPSAAIPLALLVTAALVASGAGRLAAHQAGWPAWAWKASRRLPAGFRTTIVAGLGAALVPAVALAARVPGMRPSLWGFAEGRGAVPLAAASALPAWAPTSEWTLAAFVVSAALLGLVVTTRRLLPGGRMPSRTEPLPGVLARLPEILVGAACLELYWAFSRAAILSLGEGRPVLGVAASLVILGSIPWLAALGSPTAPDLVADLYAGRRGAAAVQSACLFLVTGQFFVCLAGHVALAAGVSWLAPLPERPAPALDAVQAVPLDIEPTVL